MITSPCPRRILNTLVEQQTSLESTHTLQPSSHRRLKTLRKVSWSARATTRHRIGHIASTRPPLTSSDGTLDTDLSRMYTLRPPISACISTTCTIPGKLLLL